MSWFHLPGLLFVILILIPNLLFAAIHKDGFENLYHNPTAELLEQIGRFGCFVFMFFTPPMLCRGYWFAGGRMAYWVAGSLLTALYCLGWAVFWKESSVRKALTLSILPSLLFLVSGVLLLHLPLLVLSVLFAVCHITISYRNAIGG